MFVGLILVCFAFVCTSSGGVFQDDLFDDFRSSGHGSQVPSSIDAYCLSDAHLFPSGVLDASLSELRNEQFRFFMRLPSDGSSSDRGSLEVLPESHIPPPTPNGLLLCGVDFDVADSSFVISVEDLHSGRKMFLQRVAMEVVVESVMGWIAEDASTLGTVVSRRATFALNGTNPWQTFAIVFGSVVGTGFCCVITVCVGICVICFICRLRPGGGFLREGGGGGGGKGGGGGDHPRGFFLLSAFGSTPEQGLNSGLLSWANSHQLNEIQQFQEGIELMDDDPEFLAESLKVKTFLEKNDLGQYYETFKEARIIYSDLFQLDVLSSDVIEQLIFLQTDRQKFVDAAKNLAKSQEVAVKVGDVEIILEEFDLQAEGLTPAYVIAKMKQSNVTVLDKNSILMGKHIAKGAYGSVSRGILRFGLEKFPVAVKTVNVTAQNHEEILNEVKIMTSVDHINVLKSFGMYVDGDVYYITMEYCRHGDLSHVVVDLNPNVLWRLNVVMQVAFGMNALHDHGILHRDLKAPNILLRGKLEEPIVKICDFGTAKEQSYSEETSAMSMTLVGTPEYICPEQMDPEAFDMSDYDPKLADVYAYGILLHFVFSGVNPLEAMDVPFGNQFEVLRNLKERKARPSVSLVRHLPEDLVDLMTSCWSEDFGCRPESFQTILDVLQEDIHDVIHEDPSAFEMPSDDDEEDEEGRELEDQ